MRKLSITREATKAMILCEITKDLIWNHYYWHGVGFDISAIIGYVISFNIGNSFNFILRF